MFQAVIEAWLILRQLAIVILSVSLGILHAYFSTYTLSAIRRAQILRRAYTTRHNDLATLNFLFLILKVKQVLIKQVK